MPVSNQFGCTRLFCVVVASFTGLPTSFASAGEWTAAEIRDLFPQPAGEWIAGEVQVQELKTITSDFEAMASLPLADPPGISVRLKVARTYSSMDRNITVSIDTEDIESAVSIDGITAAYNSSSADRVRIQDAGMTPVEQNGYSGLALKAGASDARVFRVSAAGILSMECDVQPCGKDLDQLLQSFDLAAVAAFVQYDHRR